MPTLLDDTLTGLAKLPRWVTMSQVAKDTGVKLSWLSAFVAGQIEDPGVKKVQAINDYLKVLPAYKKPERLYLFECLDLPITPAISCVYEIMNDKILYYVGSTGDLRKRLRNHCTSGKFNQMPQALVKVTLFEVESEDMKLHVANQRHALERMKIKNLNPVFNMVGNKPNV